MAETADLVLEHLRALRADIADVRKELGEIRNDMVAIRQNMAGIVVTQKQHDGDIIRIKARLEQIETSIEPATGT